MFKWFKKKQRRIHLDYAATTPLDLSVLAAMQPYLTELWANPSALYREGVVVREAIESARAQLAQTLHIRARDVTFTSGGTEANNLAIAGVIEAAVEQGRFYTDIEVITTSLEHPSILELLKWYARRGVVIKYVPTTAEGLIEVRALADLLSARTILVTFAYVNSEIGVIQPVKQITRCVRAHNTKQGTAVLTHIDACQAPLWLSCELDRLGVDLLTLDAGKCYGPKGFGILARRHHVPLVPMMRGGDQEYGFRPGTENPALIVGGVMAIVRAQKEWEVRSARVTDLRNYFITKLEAAIPAVHLNGSRTERVANNVNISIPGLDTEYAVIALDATGIAAATKSACGGARGGGSTVVRAVSNNEALARSTLRFTLGEETIREEIEITITALKRHCEQMKNYSFASEKSKS